MILEDEKFLSDLFGQLRDAKTSEDRRKELVSMLLMMLMMMRQMMTKMMTCL